MAKVTEARLASNVRIATCRVELVHAIGRTMDQHPGLTHEEALSALLAVARRHVGHLLTVEEGTEAPREGG
jgi:hypothetical protein